MNEGVKILLDRMETHPEEFYGHSRWRRTIMDYENDLEEADQKALLDGFKKCRQQEFSGLIVSKLLEEEAEDRMATSLLTPKGISESAMSIINKEFNRAYEDYTNELEETAEKKLKKESLEFMTSVLFKQKQYGNP